MNKQKSKPREVTYICTTWRWNLTISKSVVCGQKCGDKKVKFRGSSQLLKTLHIHGETRCMGTLMQYFGWINIKKKIRKHMLGVRFTRTWIKNCRHSYLNVGFNFNWFCHKITSFHFKIERDLSNSWSTH